jgi:hypothetical protein
VGPDGTILVVDALNKTVYRFRADGFFLDSIGRAGGGPGEFRHPLTIAAGPNGEIAVGDGAASSLTIWFGAGGNTSRTAVPGHLASTWWTRGGLFLKAFPLGAAGPPEEGKVLFYRATPGAATAVTPVASVRYRRDLQRHMATGLTCEYCPATVTPEGAPLVSDADPTAYRIVQVGPDGQPLRIWQRERLPPVPFTRTELEQIRAGMARVGQPFDPSRFRYRPRIAGIAMDDLGNLWVLRNVPDGKPPALDVFDPNGRFLTSLEVPPASRELKVRGNTVLLVGEGESGEPAVHVFRAEYHSSGQR